MPVLDGHIHIFPPSVITERDRIADREAEFGAIYGDRRARMADVDGLLAYMEREGIEKVIAMCFPFRDRSLIRLSNDYVIDAAKTDDRIVPFICVDLYDEREALAEAARCADKGARGIGELAWYNGAFGANERKAIDPLLTYLERTGMVLAMHLNEQVGHYYPGKAKADLAEVVRLAVDHPDLSIILAHMGGGLCFYEFMPEIGKAFSRVYYDLAAVPFLYSDALYRFIESFIADKVIFGSDYPMLTLERYKSRIEALGEEVGRKVLWENGRRLLGG
jgi:predicted TIM-barrel fold metal-dependent hydrolase